MATWSSWRLGPPPHRRQHSLLPSLDTVSVSSHRLDTYPLPYLSLFFCQLQTFCYHCMLDRIYDWLPEVGEVPGAGQQLLGPGEVGQEVLGLDPAPSCPRGELRIGCGHLAVRSMCPDSFSVSVSMYMKRREFILPSLLSLYLDTR